MTDAAWDQVYATKGMAEYPDNALIRFVAKHYYGVQDRNAVRFLDIGCGYGASAWYLARAGFRVLAIDVSAVALERMEQRLEKEGILDRVLIVEGDVSESPQWKEIDCVIDVSSLCYLSASQIGPTMRKLHAALKPGGRMFSITPAHDCAPELFEAFAEGVSVKARFQAMEEAAANFAMFKTARVDSYRYVTNDKRASLWVIEAQK